jgi:hypothetical protein
VKPTISNPIPMNTPQTANSVNLINNFNNNYRSQTNGFPHCLALYDFEAENPGELSFKVMFLEVHVHSKTNSFVLLLKRKTT